MIQKREKSSSYFLVCLIIIIISFAVFLVLILFNSDTIINLSKEFSEHFFGSEEQVMFGPLGDGCVDLDNLGSSDPVHRISDDPPTLYDYYINDSMVLCSKEYTEGDGSRYNGVIIINASNIIFDCNNSMINDNDGGNDEMDIGIAAYNKTNITLINCSLRGFGKGLHFYNVTNSSVSDFIVSTYNGSALSITNKSNMNYFDRINITSIGSDLGSYIGIKFSESKYNTFNNSFLYDIELHGIYFLEGSDYNKVYNTVLINGGMQENGAIRFIGSRASYFSHINISNSQKGIYGTGGNCGDHIFKNFYINNSEDFGIEIGTGCTNVTIEDSIITNFNLGGIYILSDNTTVRRAYIEGMGSTSDSIYGGVIVRNNNREILGIVLEDITVTNSSASGILVRNASAVLRNIKAYNNSINLYAYAYQGIEGIDLRTNVYAIDSDFRDGRTDNTDFRIMASSYGGLQARVNVTLLNSSYQTFTKSVSSSQSQFTVKWHLDNYAEYADMPLSDVNVTGKNNAGTIIFSEKTDANGRTKRINMTEFIRYGSTLDSITYYNNYTLNASGTYGEINRSINFTSSRFEIFDFGGSSGLQMRTNLSNADASWYGEDGNDYSGGSVSYAGDVNGDGYDDLIIGAFGDEYASSSNAGQSYIIYGGPTGTLKMRTNLSNVNVSFYGEDNTDFSGNSVSYAGDVNGDGYNDLIIGAKQDEYPVEGATYFGQSYIIYGNLTGLSMRNNISNANASFYGERTSDYSGDSVSYAGDVNGDGYDDLIIGAPSNDYSGGVNPGQSYLAYGGPTGTLKMRTNLSDANASFYGEDGGDYSGGSVSYAGDVNGDGYDDLIIGADNDEYGSLASAGQSYIIYGGPTGTLKMRTNLSNANASFYGEDGGDYSGGSVSYAGDVNGDSYDDLIIGAQGDEYGSASRAGQSYLIYGGPTGTLKMRTNLSDANASFYGERTGDYSGTSVSYAGDVNGDGYDDLLIGANSSSYNNVLGSGQTYIIYGGPTGTLKMRTNLSNANASFYGEDEGDNAGNSVSYAGDVNGDGYDDLIIGADNDEYGSSARAGQSYLIYGDNSGYNVKTINSFVMTENSDYSGSVGSIVYVDVNQFLYMSMSASGGDPGVRDIAIVYVNSTYRKTPVKIKLIETGDNTNEYHGRFQIRPGGSNRLGKKIGVANNSMLFATSRDDATKTDSVTIVYGSPSASGCGNLDISGEIYELVQNVNSGSTCFNITAEDITLDCQGHEITYAQSIRGNAVYSNSSNTTIRNCIIKEGSVGSDRNAIEFGPGSKESSAVKNIIETISPESDGIYINENNITVGYNSISTTGNYSRGIRTEANYSEILYNNITTYAEYAYGVQFRNVSNFNHVYGNNITTKGNFSFGINFYFNATNNSVANNRIFTYGNSSYGIRLIRSDNNNISFNIINTSYDDDSHGIWINDSNFNEIYRNNISTSGYYARGVRVDGTHNNLLNNRIITYGNNSYGIQCREGADNNRIFGNWINTNGFGAYVINLFEGPKSITIENNILYSNNNKSYGIRLDSAENIAIRNNTINTYGPESDGIFFDIGTNYSLAVGNRISTFGNYSSAINMDAGKNNNITLNQIFSDSLEGWIVRVYQSKFYNEICWNFINGTAVNNRGIQISSSSNINVSFNNITLSGDGSLGIRPYSEGNNFISNNIIKTNGTSSSGITLSFTKNNFIQKNIIGTSGQYSYGIEISLSNDSFIVDNFIEAKRTHGLYLSSSSHNKVIRGIINNSGWSAIYLSGSNSENNSIINVSIVNTSITNFDLRFGTDGINGTEIYNTHIGNYSFLLSGGKIKYKNDYGAIEFLSEVNGSGNNLSRDIMILDNLAIVETSRNYGLNRSANVTLYYIGDRGFARPVILRDNQICPESMCQNFTALNAINVSFNVTSWTEYALGDYLGIYFDPPTPENGSELSDNNLHVNLTTSALGEHYSFVNLDKSLFAWLRMDNDSTAGENSTYVYDWSGYGNNGTVNGSTWNSTGRFGGAFNFDALDGYIYITGNPALGGTKSFSYSAWIKRVDNSLGEDDIINHGGGRQFYIQSNNLVFYSTISHALSGTTVIQPDVWYHTVFTYNGSLGTLYLNGQAENSNANYDVPTISNSNLMIGRCQASHPDHLFNGTIDEVLIFNRTLSADEVSSLYNTSQYKYAENFTILESGMHKFTGYAVDLLGTLYETDERVVTIIKPMIYFVPPTLPNGAMTRNMSEIVNISIIERNLDEVKFNWDGVNYTLFNDSLVLMMNFDNVSALGEGYGGACSFVADLSGYGNNGSLSYNGCNTANVPTWNKTGKYGGAFQFRSNTGASGQTINISNSPSLNPGSGNFAIATWFKTGGSYDGDFVRKGSSSGGQSEYYNLEHSPSHLPGNNSFCFELDTTTGDYQFVTENSFRDEKWHFIVAQRVGSNAEIWIDGINQALNYYQSEVEVSSLSVSGSISNNVGLGIASKLYTGNPDFWNGSIDELRIYMRSFSQDEIQQLYYTNLNKYDINKWNLFVNQTLTLGQHSYSASVKNELGINASTETRTLNALMGINLVENCLIISERGTYVLPANLINNSVDGACINITASDVYFDCDGYYIQSISNKYGIYSYGNGNVSVIDCNVTMGSGSGADAIRFDYSGLSRIINTTVKANRGIVLSNSNYNFIYNLSIFDSVGEGIYLNEANNNNFTFGKIINSGMDAISLNGANSDRNLFRNLIILDTNMNYRDLYIGTEGIDDTYLIDMPHIGGYYLTGSGGKIFIRSSAYGEIRFLQPVTGSGGNFSSDISIGYDSAQVNSTNNAGLNRSANVSLYGLPYDFSNPRVFRYDGSVNLCDFSMCYNFTSLNNINVLFNVTYWTRYYVASSLFGDVPPIVEFKDPTYPHRGITKNNFTEINISIIDPAGLEGPGIKEIMYNWNGTNFSYYDPSLVLMMNFDNRSSLGENDTFVRDLSIYGSNGTAMNTTWISKGRYGGAFNFSRDSNYINLTNPSSLDFGAKTNKSFTISAWIYPISYGEESTYGNGRIIDKSNPGTNAAGGYLLMLLGPSNQRLVLILNGNNINSDNGAIVLNNWQFITVVFADTSTGDGIVTFYVNGERKGRVATPYDPATSSSEIYIGSGVRDDFGRDFNGTIDEIRIWNRTLSDREINQTYHSNLYKYDIEKWNLYINQSKLVNGVYSYYGGARDTENHYVTTETRLLTIGDDILSPDIYFVPPTPANASIRESIYATVNVSIDEYETGIKEIIYNWDNTNYSIYDSNLILMMNFNNYSSLGESDTFVRDLSMYGNNGTCIFRTSCPIARGGQGPISWASRFGHGSGFCTDDCYYTIADSPILTTSQYTISAWVYLNTSLALTDDRELVVFNGATPMSFGVADETTPGSSGRLRYNCGSQVYSSSSFFTNKGNQWAYITFTKDSSNIRFYVNGIPDGSPATPACTGIFNPTAIYIGTEAGAGTEGWHGYVDEIAIWNRSLSEAEIVQSYMTNLQRYDRTRWDLFVNQGKNATAGLVDMKNYTYFAATTDLAGNYNMTEKRYLYSDFRIIDISDIKYANIMPAGYKVINFNVYVLGIDSSNVGKLNASFASMGTVRENSSCNYVNKFGDTLNYSCSIGIWYYDPSGLWNVTARLYDSSNVFRHAYNETFIVMSEACINHPSFLDFGTLTMSSTDVWEDFLLKNYCNSGFTQLSVKGEDLLRNGVGPDAIDVERFYVNEVLSTGDCAIHDQLSSIYSVNINGATLPVSDGSTGSGERTLGFCLNDIPAGLSASGTYNTAIGKMWVLTGISDVESENGFCGDGIIDDGTNAPDYYRRGEVCECGNDGICGTSDDNIGSNSCISLGYSGGALSCSFGCKQFDTSKCGLYMHLGFDDPISDGITIDSSGNGNYGACTGTQCPAYIEDGGHDGSGAYDFDGVNDFINITSQIVMIDDTGPFSISAWAYLDEFSGPYHYPHILALERVGDINSGAFQIFFSIDDRYEMISFGTYDGIFVRGRYNSESSTDRWIHVALTFDGTGPSLLSSYAMYIDGDDVPLSTSEDFTLLNNDRNFVGASGIDGDWMDGKIDDIRVWDRELSADEVRSIYSGLW